MGQWKYIPGDPWKICDICGFKVRASQTRLNWKGQVVCLKDWERKHPSLEMDVEPEQDFVVEDARPRQTDIEIEME